MHKQSNGLKAVADRRLSQLKADPYLAQKVCRAAAAEAAAAQAGRSSSRALRRVLVPVLTLALCLAAGLTVLGNYTYFQQFISSFGRDAQNQLAPVLETVTAGGIQLEVLAAVADPEGTVVYVALRDGEYADRIDSTTEIYVQNGPEDAGFATGTLTHYDEANQTAVFRIDLQNMNPETQESICLRVAGIRSGKAEHLTPDIGLSLSSLAQSPSPMQQEAALQLYSIQYGASAGVNQRLETLLEASAFFAPLVAAMPDSLALPDWLYVEGLGIQDGLLYIRYRIVGDMPAHSAPVFQLYQNGLPLSELARADAGLEQEEYVFGHTGIRRGIAILELPGGEVADGLTLGLQYLEYGTYMDNGWQVTFNIPPRDSDRVVSTSIPIQGGEITEIRITPVSAIISGYSNYDPTAKFHQIPSLSVEAYFSRGKKAETFSSSTIGRDDDANDNIIRVAYKLDFSLPIDPNTITYISINGTEIPLA